MNDLMQRLKDWRVYRHRYRNDIIASKGFITAFRSRSIFWFLLQSRQERLDSEALEIRMLEEMLEKYKENR